mmetsp:Transcript_12112/g.29340  ORF Transcript_12112/g.29340 Transcript_12112/m.29340 type:complete len:225 (-) Transcript_12112:818-1492(-)
MNTLRRLLRGGCVPCGGGGPLRRIRRPLPLDGPRPGVVSTGEGETGGGLGGCLDRGIDRLGSRGVGKRYLSGSAGRRLRDCGVLQDVGHDPGHGLVHGRLSDGVDLGGDSGLVRRSLGGGGGVLLLLEVGGDGVDDGVAVINILGLLHLGGDPSLLLHGIHDVRLGLDAVSLGGLCSELLAVDLLHVGEALHFLSGNLARNQRRGVLVRRIHQVSGVLFETVRG